MDPGSLDLELERAALHALHAEWLAFNFDLFRDAMVKPVLVLSLNEQKHGYWDPGRRTLGISRALVFGHPWPTVREVLKHEMAHQFVSEVLRADESAHGPAFARVCRERNIDAAATGLAESPAGGERHKIIERVQKLLALATSKNEHEAQTAMNAAQRLMLEHNIEEARSQGRRFVSRTLGEPSGRLEESRSRIGGLLAKHFFVCVIELRVWNARAGKPGTVLEVTGTPENVAMAEYVYAFLDRTADALWIEHKRARAIRGDRERRAFRAGVVDGFRIKLESERKTQVERGLIWVGDPELDRHYRARYPRIVTVRSAGSQGAEARKHGREAGQKLVLARPVESSGSSGTTRALGDGRR